MNLLVLLAIFAASVLLLTYWRRALARRLSEIDSKGAAITLFAGSALTGFLRYVAVVALATYAILFGVLLAAQTITGPLQTEAMVAAIGRARVWQAWLGTFSGFASYLFWTVVVLGLSYWIYRRAHVIGNIVLHGKPPGSADTEAHASEGTSALSRNQVLHVLVSRGALSTLGKGFSSLSIAGLVCTFVSIVAAESGGIVATRIVYLSEMTVERSQPEAQAAWQALKRDAPDDPQPRPDPDPAGGEASNAHETETAQAAQYLANHFERAFIDSLGTELRRPPAEAAEALERLRTRASILREFVRAAGESRVVALEPTLSEAVNLSESERAALSRLEQAPPGKSTHSVLGELAEKHIKAELEKAPSSLRQSIVEGALAWKASFAEPARPMDFIGRAVGDVTGNLIGGAVKAVTDPGEDVLRQVGAKAVSSILRSEFKRLYEARLSRYLMRMAAGESPQVAFADNLRHEQERPLVLPGERAAIEKVVGETAAGTPSIEETLDKLRLSRPTLVVKPTAEEFVRTAGELNRKLGGSADGTSRVNRSAALISYADLFPGQLASASRTALAQWLGKLPAERPELVQRSFDFERVQHLTKVGRNGRTRRAYEPPRPRNIDPLGDRRSIERLQGAFGISEVGKLRAEKAELEKKLEQIIGEQSEARKPEESIEAVFRFNAASLHSKVGGVVIGREPAEGGSNVLDFRNLHWESDGDRLELSLQRKDGSYIGVPGSFKRDRVQQALAFAADGRPVVATIIQSWPSNRLKVLLHPALMDSPLGRDAIRLDSAVDLNFTDPARLAAVERLNDAVSLYEFARVRIRRSIASDYVSSLAPERDNLQARLASISREISPTQPAPTQPTLGVLGDLRRNRGDSPDGLRSLAPRIPVPLRLPPTGPDALRPGRTGDASSRAPQRLAPPRGIQPESWPRSHAILADRPDVFDPLVVATLSACKNSTFLDALDRCLLSTVKTDQRPKTRAQFRQQLAALTSAHHAVGVVSGVRERAYRTDPELSFLSPPASDGVKATLWPFDFVLQATFTKLAAAHSGEAPSKHDVPSLPLPGIDHGDINAAVRDAVVSDPNLAGALQRMREFTVLQRLFRLGLNGNLGANFPAYRLAELARAVSGTPIEQIPTARWIEPLQATGETHLINASDIRLSKEKP